MTDRDPRGTSSRRLLRAILRLRRAREPPREVVTALVVSAAVAFVLLGLLLRAGSAAPGGSATELAFQAMLAVGVVAHNAAFLLAALVVALAVWSSWDGDPALAWSLIVLLVLVVLAVPFQGSAPALAAARTVGLAGVVALLGVRHLGSRPAGPTIERSVFVAAILGVYAFVALAFVANAASLPGAAPAFGGGAEVAAIVVAAVAPWTLSRSVRWPAVAIGAVAAVALVLLALRTPLLPLIATWAVSFSLHLPIALYAFGLAGLAYVLAERMPRERLHGAAGGLALLVVAGIGLRSTYEVLLVAAGALVLFRALAIPAE